MKKQIFLILTIFSFLFASCSNLFESLDNSDSRITDRNGTIKYVTITGSVQLDGAFPEEVGRTAFPSKPAVTAFDLYITAKNTADSTEKYEDMIFQEDNDGTYTIGIPVADTIKNYTIEIVAKKEGSSIEILKGESEAFDISVTEPVVRKNINLHAISDEGQGTFKLEIDVSGTDINCGAMLINQMYEGSIQEISHSAYVEDGKIIIRQAVIPDSGSYKARFKLFKDSQELYSFTQTVNVYSGLETSKWVKNGAEPYLDDSGTSTVCKITPALIRDYELTNIYIDSSKQTTNSSLVNYTSASGTFLNPLTTFEAAVAKIQNSTKDYTIHVKGSFQGCFELPADLDTRMNSLTIVGESPLVNGQPQDKLYGYAGFEGDEVDFRIIKEMEQYQALRDEGKNSPVLTVSTNKPISIANLEISKGLAGKGGGINITAGKVTLNNGAVVKNNKTMGQAGGVFVDSGATLIINGAKITGNSTYDSNGNSMGGGICLRDGGCLRFIDGEISSNRAFNMGGGVFSVRSDESKPTNEFIMTGGKICSNTVNGIVYNSGSKCGYGGAVNMSDGQFIMSGGEISDNHANYDVGGVYLNGGNLTMTGGVIKNNTAEHASHAIYVNNTSSLEIGGTAYVPAGEDQSHDIQLNHYSFGGDVRDSKITLIGSLTRHSKDDPIVITPGQYSRGLHLVEADDDYITDVTAYKEYFKVPDTAWDLFVSSDKKAITINSPIYIASPTANPTFCTNKGNDTTGTGEKSAPYATFARACTDMTDDTVEYIILVDGTITGENTITGTAKSVSISGANGIDNYKEEGYVPADCLDGNYVNRALTINIEKEVFISNLKIQNGNDTSDVGGGGIFIPSGATVTINEGVLITGNTASTYGGGIYNNGTLYIKGGVITGNTAASGGGLYNAGTSTAPATATLENSAVIGTKFSVSGTEPSHAVATESEKSNYASLNGGGVYNSDFASFTMDASLTESGGGIYYNYSKNSDDSLVMGTGGIQNYGTLTLNGGVIAYNGGKKVGAINHCSRNLTVDGVTIAFNAAEEVGSSCGGIYIMDDSELSCVVEYKNGIFKNNVDGNSDSSKGIGIYIESATSNPTVKITGGTFAANTVIYLEDNCYIQSGSSYYSSNIIFELQNYTEARTLVSSIDNTTVSSYWKYAKIMNDKMEVFESYRFSSSTVRTSAVALYKLDKVTADDVSISGYNSSDLSMEDGDQYNRNLKTRFDGNFYFKTSNGKYGVMRFTDITGFNNRMPIKYSMFDWEDRTAQSSCIWPSGKDFDEDSDGSGGDGKNDFYVYLESNGNVAFDQYWFRTQNGAVYKQMH